MKTVEGKLYHVAYPIEGSDERHRGRHHATRDDARRYRGGVASRQDDRYQHLAEGRFAVCRRRSLYSVHCRRGRRSRVRDRPGQGDAGSRPDRLRDRSPSRSGSDSGDRSSRRMTAEAGEAYAGLDRFEARRRVVEALDDQGLSGRGRKLHPQRRALPAQRRAGRAAWSRPSGSSMSRAWRRRRCRRWPREIWSWFRRAWEKTWRALAGEHQALVYLTAALVGPSDPGLVRLRGRRVHRRR